MELKNMKEYFLYSYLIICLLNCKKPANKIGNTEGVQPENLTTTKAHQAYLLQIFRDDQKLRKNQWDNIAFKYGRKSQELKDFVALRQAQDEQNLAKIEAYLLRYGHPKPSEVGEVAGQTP